MRLYYEQRDVEVWCGDGADVWTVLPEQVALVLTDPPYSPQTHRGARTLAGGKGPRGLIDFDHMSLQKQYALFEAVAPLCRAWVVSSLDWKYAAAMEVDPPAGLKYVRTGIWVKPNAAPQFTGDRPGMGWEALGIMHADVPGRMKWNGGGHHAVFTHNVARRQKGRPRHPAEKPVPLLREIVRLFSNPGDLVLDLCCGSGAVLEACLREGRRAVGVELAPYWCEATAARCEATAEEMEETDGEGEDTAA